MSTITRAELRNQVLAELRVLDPAEAPEAEDATDANRIAQSVLEYLHGEGLIPFDLDSDAIPIKYLAPLAPIIAVSLISTYNADEYRVAIESDAARGMKALRRMKAQPYFGTVATANYF